MCSTQRVEQYLYILDSLAGNMIKLLASALIAACMLPPSTSQAAPSTAAPSEQKVCILYTGDTHGELRSANQDTNRNSGGIARRSTFILEQRQHQDEIYLLLDAGDAISGTADTDLLQGTDSIAAMNMLGYDAMALGIHDFDYGIQVLRQRMSQAKFPILCANVVQLDTGQPIAQPYVIITRQGLRIAVIGLITEELQSRAAPESLFYMQVLDPVLTAKDLVEYLHDKADIIVALTHQGVAQDIELGVQVPSLSAIIGGMDHARLNIPIKIRSTLVDHAGAWGEQIGQLKLTLAPGQDGKYATTEFDNKLIELNDKYAQDPTILTWLEIHEKQVQAGRLEVVGQCAKQMPAYRALAAETEIGNFTCDLLRAATKADVCLLPAGIIGGAMREGPVTIGDLYDIWPSEDQAVIVTLTGAELLSALSDACRQIGLTGFPQVSGMKFMIYGGEPRVVEINGILLDNKKSYTLATLDSCARGEYGYPHLGTSGAVQYTGRRMRDLLIDQIRTGTQLSASIGKRYVFVSSEPTLPSLQDSSLKEPAAQPTDLLHKLIDLIKAAAVGG